MGVSQSSIKLNVLPFVPCVSMALSSSFTSHPEDVHDFICPLSQMSPLLSLPCSVAAVPAHPLVSLRLLWWWPQGSFPCPFSDLLSNPVFSKRNTGKGPVRRGCWGCGVSEMRRVQLLKKGLVGFWRQLEHQLPLSLFILGTHPHLHWYFSITVCVTPVFHNPCIH